jgi:hypothetical protein
MGAGGRINRGFIYLSLWDSIIRGIKKDNYCQEGFYLHKSPVVIKPLLCRRIDWETNLPYLDNTPFAALNRQYRRKKP